MVLFLSICLSCFVKSISSRYESRTANVFACELSGSIRGDMKRSSPSSSPLQLALNPASNGLSSASFPPGERTFGESMFRGWEEDEYVNGKSDRWGGCYVLSI